MDRPLIRQHLSNLVNRRLALEKLLNDCASALPCVVVGRVLEDGSDARALLLVAERGVLGDSNESATDPKQCATEVPVAPALRQLVTKLRRRFEKPTLLFTIRILSALSKIVVCDVEHRPEPRESTLIVVEGDRTVGLDDGLKDMTPVVVGAVASTS